MTDDMTYICRWDVNNVQIWHAEKTSNTDYLANHLHNPEMKQFNIPATEKTSNTDYLANHLHDPEMKQFNILATNSIK